jgi:alpha-tubulin suppressor-like RCC1 family protein
VVWKPTKVYELDSIGVLDIASCETCTFVLCNDANLYSVGTGLNGQLGHQDIMHEKLVHFRLVRCCSAAAKHHGLVKIFLELLTRVSICRWIP